MRKIIGSSAMVTWLVVYVAIAGVIGDRVLDEHWVVQALFFPIAGMGWVLPLRPLLNWMHAGDPPQERTEV